MKEVSEYNAQLEKLVGHPSDMAKVIEGIKDNEELMFYMLKKYDYMNHLIRDFSREALSRNCFGIAELFRKYKNYIISNIEHSTMELCGNYDINWLCHNNNLLFIDGNQLSVSDGYPTICSQIVSICNKRSKLVR